MSLLLIVLAIIFFIIVFFIAVYNSIIRREQRVRQAQSEIERELNRVAELLPNLVNSVKGAGLLEQKVLTQISESYSKYLSAIKSSKDLSDRINTSSSFFGTIMPIILQLPQYPQLQSMQQFQMLFNEIRVSIDKVSYARQFLNDAINDYNTYILSFPGIIIAKLLGKKELPYFRYERSEETRRSLESGEFTKGLSQW
ncbi:LemA family protein [Nanoarchaeota archaeon NZ13-N]|uniref:LemA family protein n=1 Tax=Candidatus Nanoclepta minutus TaxID=1940235 RepID=A0A397WMU8_9ARCH|nr:MAG: LemA family protein [Nanoarchaeota archaeon NZ13-N]RIB35395.1 MAG: hypothetical protein BXU00_01355 [Candidatus Nanoclepta minutus]